MSAGDYHVWEPTKPGEQPVARCGYKQKLDDEGNPTTVKRTEKNCTKCVPEQEPQEDESV